MVRRLTQVLRLYPLRSAMVGRRLAEAVLEGLGAGRPFGVTLRASLEHVVSTSVDVALLRFESGAVALFIVDLRDALVRRFERAAAVAAERADAPGGRWVRARLRSVAVALKTEMVEQHLINAVLGVTGLYAEAMTLDPSRVDRDALVRQVTTMLQQSLSTVFNRAELAVTLDEVPRAAKVLPGAPLASA